jgi:hypothetical protein
VDGIVRLIVEENPTLFPDPEKVTFDCGTSLNVLFGLVGEDRNSLVRKCSLLKKLFLGCAVLCAGLLVALVFVLLRQG